MRRGVGISSLERHTATNASYSTLSSTLSASSLQSLQSQLQLFQSSLRTFATKHASSIRSDPAFRTAFSTMCAELGVDPLGGGKKGLWDYVGVGEWTYELAVQVVDVCLRSRERNGGLIEMEELLKGVRALREGPAPPSSTTSISKKATKKSLEGSITKSDIIRALKALEPLGSGYTLINLNSRKLIRSVPSEFDNDSLAILNAASASSTSDGQSEDGMGWTTHSELKQSQGWTWERTRTALENAMMGEGLAWVDEQAGAEDRYYVGTSAVQLRELLVTHGHTQLASMEQFCICLVLMSGSCSFEPGSLYLLRSKSKQ